MEKEDLDEYQHFPVSLLREHCKSGCHQCFPVL
jgi:hypothetical protein